MTDPNPARKRTQSKSYREEAEDDVETAIRFCHFFLRGGNGLDLEKAKKHIEMAMSRDTHSNELAGGTLE